MVCVCVCSSVRVYVLGCVHSCFYVCIHEHVHMYTLYTPSQLHITSSIVFQVTYIQPVVNLSSLSAKDAHTLTSVSSAGL